MSKSSDHAHASDKLAERRAKGAAWRHQVPLSAHAEWQPPANRADPVEVLIEQGKTRIQELLPVRYKRMKCNSFAFLRGAAVIMAADLAAGPSTGLRVQRMNVGLRRAVACPHPRCLGGRDFQQIRQIVQFDFAAHAAELPRHRGGVVGDLRPVFHDSLRALWTPKDETRRRWLM